MGSERGRILLTHDVHTMTKYAYDRIRAGLPMPGMIEVREDLAIGQAIIRVGFIYFRKSRSIRSALIP